VRGDLFVETSGFNPSVNDSAALQLRGSWGGGLVFSESTNRSGIYSAAGEDLRFVTGGTSAGFGTAGFVIDSSGNSIFGGTVGSAGLQVDVEGRVGATEYCDNTGVNCSTPAAIATAISAGGADDFGNHLATADIRAINGTAASPSLTFDTDQNTGIYHITADQLGITTGGALRGTFSQTGLVLSGRVRTAGGSPAVPAFSFGNDTDTGIYRSGTNTVAIAGDGVLRASFSSVGITTPGGIRTTDGTASLPSHTFSSDTDSGLYRTGSNEVGISTGGGLRATFNSTGIVLPSALRVTAAATPISGSHLTNKTYVDAQVAAAGGADNLGNHTATQTLNMSGEAISNVSGLSTGGHEAISSGNYRHTANYTNDNNYGYFEVENNSGTRGAYFGFGNGGSRVDLALDAASNLYITGGNVGIGAVPGGTFDNTTALAIGDSDTGIRQNGDGVLEMWANNQEVAQFTTGGFVTNRYGTAGTYNSSQVQGIWSIGDNFQVDLGANDFGNQYGLVYAFDTNSGSISGWGHQYQITENGVRRITFSGSTGRIGAAEYCDNTGANCSTPAAIATAISGGGSVWTDGGATTYLDGDNVAIGKTTAATALDVDGDITAIAYLYSSDRRLKEDFKSFAEKARSVLDIDTYRFLWKDSGEEDFGVIAQEVEELFPELVVNKGDGYKGVDYAQLVIPLLEVTKQQQSEIDELREMIEELQR